MLAFSTEAEPLRFQRKLNPCVFNESRVLAKRRPPRRVYYRGEEEGRKKTSERIENVDEQEFRLFYSRRKKETQTGRW